MIFYGNNTAIAVVVVVVVVVLNVLEVLVLKVLVVVLKVLEVVAVKKVNNRLQLQKLTKHLAFTAIAWKRSHKNINKKHVSLSLLRKKGDNGNILPH